MIEPGGTFATIVPIASELRVLIGRSLSVRSRLIRVGLGTALAMLPIGVWYVLAQAEIVPWPQASGPLGVWLGLIGAAIIFFEMAIAPRKWFRGWRLGSTRTWMRWHIWLGLAVLPVIVIHSGFNWGGTLSTVTMLLFLLVIASGVYGLALQQVIPKKIFDEIPAETIASQIDFAISKHVSEARGIVDDIDTKPLTDFFNVTLDPYLQNGKRARTALTSATESARLFNRLRSSLADEYDSGISQLEKIADLRRLWDRQARLNWWLHSWLAVHVPLSVMMTGLMVLHAVFAMKWWW